MHVYLIQIYVQSYFCVMLKPAEYWDILTSQDPLKKSAVWRQIHKNDAGRREIASVFIVIMKKKPVDLSSRRLKFCTICKLWFPSESSNKIHLFLFLRSKLTTVTGFYKTINIVTIGPSTDFLVWFL